MRHDNMVLMLDLLISVSKEKVNYLCKFVTLIIFYLPPKKKES